MNPCTEDPDDKVRPRIAAAFLAVVALGAIVLILSQPVGVAAQEEGVTAHPEVPLLTPKQQADMLLMKRQYGDALAAYRKLLEEEGAEAYVVRGVVQAYEGMGRLHEAQTYFQEYAASHPPSAPVLFGLGLTAYYLEDWAQAEKHLSRALEIDPQLALAWNALGGVAAGRGNAPKAVEQIKTAIGLNPDEPVFFNHLWSVYKRMGRADDGLRQDFQESLEKGVLPVARGYGHALARIARQEGFKRYSKNDTAGAIKKFEEVVEIYRKIQHDAGVVAGLFSLGLLHEETGDLTAAQRYFEEVLKVNPNHIQAREKVSPR